MGDVVRLNCVTTLDLDPDAILAEAQGAFDGGVLLLGYDGDGGLEMRGTFADGRDMLWLLEIAKARLLGAFEEG